MDILLVYVNGYHCLYFVMYVLHEMNGGLTSLNFIEYDTFVQKSTAHGRYKSYGT